MRVVLWRHGQTDFNVSGRVQGASDIPLNDAGREQAVAAAAKLVSLNPVAIFSSPLSRAAETAQILAGLCGVQVRIDGRLIERSFGDFEGLTRDEMRERDLASYRLWQESGDCALGGVESRVSVGERVREAIEDHVDAFYREECVETSVQEAIVFVSHGSALTQGLITLLGLDPGAWSGVGGLDNCHWSVLCSGRRAPFWRLVQHNQHWAGHELSVGKSMA